MTRDDVKRLLMVVFAFYPNWRPPDKEIVINAWHTVLEDKDQREMQLALKWHVETDTSGFAPSIGQLLERYRQIVEGENMTAGEAWGTVLKAIRNSAYSAGAEFAKLPEAVQKAVGSAETLRTWAIADEEQMGYAQAQFSKNYAAVMERSREYAVMSGDIRAMVEAKRAESIAEHRERANED